MKKNIAIVAGGDSSEIVISLKSADGIYSFIDKDKYNYILPSLRGMSGRLYFLAGNIHQLIRMILASRRMA